MARYAVRRTPQISDTRPRLYVQHTDEGAIFAPHLEVDGPRYVETGLVDLHGNEILRLPDPIGFHFE